MNSAKAKVKFNDLAHDETESLNRISKLSTTRFIAHLLKMLVTDDEKFGDVAVSLDSQAQSPDKTSSDRALEAFENHLTTKQILVRLFLQPITEVFTAISKAAQNSQYNLHCLYWYSLKVLEELQNLTDEACKNTLKQQTQASLRKTACCTHKNKIITKI